MARMPAIFFGHGNPMNALESNAYTEAWARIGRDIPRPAGRPLRLRALVPARHPGHRDGAAAHDPRLRRLSPRPARVPVRAPGVAGAGGARAGPARAAAGGSSTGSGGSTTARGRCSSTCFPEADVPVVQLSMDETQPASFHYDLGRRLAAAARRRASSSWAAGTSCTTSTPTPGAAIPRSRSTGRCASSSGRASSSSPATTAPLVDYETLGRDAHALRAHARPLPAAALRPRRPPPDDVASFPVEGIDGGSVSMLSVTLA